MGSCGQKSSPGRAFTQPRSDRTWAQSAHRLLLLRLPHSRKNNHATEDTEKRVPACLYWKRTHTHTQPRETNKNTFTEQWLFVIDFNNIICWFLIIFVDLSNNTPDHETLKVKQIRRSDSEQRSAHFLCKGLDSKYFRLAGHVRSVATTTLLLSKKKPCENELAGLCCSKTLFRIWHFNSVSFLRVTK